MRQLRGGGRIECVFPFSGSVRGRGVLTRDPFTK